MPIHAGAFFPYVVSLSVLLQVLCLPVLGAVADRSRRKKRLLALCAYLGATATVALALVQGEAYLLGGALFVVANLSFGASVVVYNAFLPQLAGPDERDAVSSRGWALGYLGGGLLLALNLLLVSRAAALGLSTAQAVRLCLLSAGAWWAVFTLVPLATLRDRPPAGGPEGPGAPAAPRPAGAAGRHVLTSGFAQLGRTLRGARAYPQTLLFLGAYLLFNDGIETVIALATQFGQEALGLSVATLTGVILMVQFVAFGGALLAPGVARAVGTKRAVVLGLLVWTAALWCAYAFLRTALDFWVLGAGIALVLGGTQALSCSLYSQLLPRGQEAAYFGLYEVSDKGTSWLGPLVFGLALQFTGDYRIALLSLVVFFLAGLALLARVDVRRGAREAGNEAPARA